MKITALLHPVVQLCKEVGNFQCEHLNRVSQTQVEDKGLNQLVSFVDQESEKRLTEALSALMPEARFIGEEFSSQERETSGYTWVIDPLDGTTNFLHGLPVFSISIALLDEGEPVLGVVHCPALGETFTALRGQGAHLNGQRIQVSSNSELSKSLLATGFPYYEFGKMQPYLDLLQVFMKGTQGLRRMGSAAIDLAYTACGRFDAFFEMNLSPWDIAAGMLLVKEAGGEVCNFKGGDSVLFGQEIVACSANLFPRFFPAVSAHLKD